MSTLNKMNITKYCFSIFRKKDNEYENLNGIRAISILFVVLFHAWVTARTILPLLQATPTVWMFLLTSLYLILITFLISWFFFLLIEELFLILKDKLTGRQNKLS